MANLGGMTSELIEEVNAELVRAETKFTGFNSLHEGYAVLLEEVDELWQEIKRSPRNREAVRAEAVQVAAMAMRFLKDCC